MSRGPAESSTAWEALLGRTLPRRVVPGRNRTKADVSFYDLDGRRVVVKSYAARPWWVRASLGRWLIARECRAYVAAGGAAGLPRLHARPAPSSLVLEWVDAEPLSSLGATRLDPAVFDRLDAIVAALHARGVALGDLHHRDVLVGASGVFVVDLATAWVLGPRPGRWRRFLFRRLSMQDRLAAARLRARFTGISEEQALASVPKEALVWHARGRALKRAFDRIRGRR
ncbi:MAG TPA: hypothetical protein VF139_04135 [Candidatus Polarisedimenticolaceae bacterium]